MTRVLVRLVKNEVRVLVDQLLHGVLDELVERVKLLPDKTFLVEEGGDNRPAVFLRDFFVFLSLAVVTIPIVIVGRLRRIICYIQL